MKIYGIRTCDTCRKAVKALPQATFIDVRVTPLGPEELTRFLDAFGAALVNTRSTTWRGLTEAERAMERVAQLTRYPTLMKRPVLDDNGALYLGWGRDVQAALL